MDRIEEQDQEDQVSPEKLLKCYKKNIELLRARKQLLIDLCEEKKPSKRKPEFHAKRVEFIDTKIRYFKDKYKKLKHEMD